MTDKPADQDQDHDQGQDRDRDRARHRPTLDEIFGDALPDTTSDERDPEQPGGDRDAWYQQNRPPHHDRD